MFWDTFFNFRGKLWKFCLVNSKSWNIKSGLGFALKWSIKKFYYWTNLPTFEPFSHILNTFLTNSIWLELFKIAKCPGKMDWRKFFRNSNQLRAQWHCITIIMTCCEGKEANSHFFDGPMGHSWWFQNP